MYKYIVLPALISIFWIGDADAKLFAQVISWSILFFAFIGLFLKSKPNNRRCPEKYFNRACNLALIASTVYLGFPFLAAAWVIIIVLTYAVDANYENEIKEQR